MIPIKKLYSFFKKECVLCISAIAALLSMIAVPPNISYIEYIDFKVICLLFCLMAVVLGFQECGFFTLLAQKLLGGKKKFNILVLILVLLPFFCSMLITNDVALITFVPFAILLLTLAEKQKHIIYVIVLQTISANLGSMATPIGNPQNLYIYTNYQLSASDFFLTMLPFTLLSLVSIVVAALFTKGEYVQINFKHREKIKNPKRLIVYSVLFTLCLLCVFHIIDYRILTILAILTILFFSKGLLLKIDYSLLLTFVFFFIFAGNMGQIDSVKNIISGMLQNNTILTSTAASQVISNVPAAVLLSEFTKNWHDLLIGVNIGGLGTPIASLASLISLKIYFKERSSQPIKYLKIFTIANVIGLAVLIGFSFIF